MSDASNSPSRPSSSSADPGAGPAAASPGALLAGLRAQLASGAVRLEIDAARLDHMDSPVGVEADSNIWVYLLLALCLAAFYQGGVRAGIAAVAASLALYLTAGRAYVRRRVVRRVHELALNDLERWRKLWRFGGIVLVAGERRCGAPEGNWMALVRELAEDAAATPQ